MADARKMYADLMGSPSPEPYGKMCKGGKALLHMVGCISGLAALWHDGHTLSVHRMMEPVMDS